MSLPDQTPKLPKIPFLLGDAVLLGAAWYIAQRDPGPLSLQAVAAITTCVVFAAIVGAIPFLADYARRQDEALDERQRGLEALSRTINTAAEQISIAANGLNELTDLTHKNLKQAEHLPHKLQDKIAEFNAQLDNARQDDREELEKEIAELRTSETDRLLSVSDKVHKAVLELTRLESTIQQKLSHRSEPTEGAQIASSRAQADALAALNEAHAAFTRQLSTSQANALSELDRKLAAAAAHAVSLIEAALSKAQHSPGTPTHHAASSSSPNGEVVTASQHPEEPAPDIASPPKRPRKARREEMASAESAAISTTPTPLGSEAYAAAPSSHSEAAPVTEQTAPDVATAEATHSPPPFLEPVPIPSDAIKQIQPVAPDSAEPFALTTPASNPAAEIAVSNKSVTEAIPSASIAPADDLSSAAANIERPVRKRAPRSPSSPTGDIQFELSDEAPASSDEAPVTSEDMVEQMISSDGASRLIATSYIGIGNRLFIRGVGPGLSWEKGVPLQFISIGKWRWESTEATTPIHFKLYKNDAIECPGLGTRVLEPGHQQEVTAKF